jgi:hypothetical protein
VAELLSVLQQATGLRSEYPPELAPARVSVMLKRPSLVEVLESALSAFNFAVWTDQDSSSVTWVKILDMRSTVEHTEQPRAYPKTKTSRPSTAVAPGLTASEAAPSAVASHPVPDSEAAAPSAVASFPLPDSEAQMAEVREDFARSITSTNELEPIPVVTSPVMMPGVGTLP